MDLGPKAELIFILNQPHSRAITVPFAVGFVGMKLSLMIRFDATLSAACKTKSGVQAGVDIWESFTINPRREIWKDKI